VSDQSTQRSTAQLSSKAQDALDQIRAAFPFNEAADIARLAFAVAVADGLSPSDREGLGGATGMTWNVNTLDPSGELAGIIRVLWPDDPDPYRVLETLMNVGLLALAQRLTDDPSFRIADLLDATEA
jgi:hypothetical protein